MNQPYNTWPYTNQPEYKSVEQMQRDDALNHAVIHCGNKSPDEVVKAAKKYLAFLKGK